jgi:hypothetical protein
MAAGLSSRRNFVGGSDARIIMGIDETALVRLWHEKRGEAEPPPRTSTGLGTSAIPAAEWGMCSAMFDIGDPLDGRRRPRNLLCLQ